MSVKSGPVRLTAVLEDGRTYEYDQVPDPPAGGMKVTYFTPDRSHVVQFFKKDVIGKDPLRHRRLQAVVNQWNVTRLNNGPYWEKVFCWPIGIVVQPDLGVVAPAFPANFFMKLKRGKTVEKKGRWFISDKSRKMVPAEEIGGWIQMLKMSILLARAVQRLHGAGLAHSDLSMNNVLFDPKGAEIKIIDIDSLVVPGMFPPDVAGTKGYIAPEVLTTASLAVGDPAKNLPSAKTDLHALAVLIYELLFSRHPLMGKKFHDPDPGRDDFLAMGPKALFIEHPSDESNRLREGVKIPYTAFGKALATVIEGAFVTGLHAPDKRPTASDWERALVQTWDLLHPCEHKGCPERWFVMHQSSGKRCPFCGTTHARPVPIIRLQEKKGPSWPTVGEIVVYNNLSLFSWHARGDVLPGPTADRTPMAYCAYYKDRWVLVNQKLKTMKSPGGNPVQPGGGGAVELKDGVEFLLADEPKGRKVSVKMLP